jgi:hypothetical protein
MNEMIPFVAGMLFTIAIIGAGLCFFYLLFIAFAKDDAKKQMKKNDK